MPQRQSCWLLKTEPASYSIDDLAREPRQTTCWDGVRNYQARNYLRDQMKCGDHVLIYHSQSDPPAVVGVAKVVREAYPDSTAWDPKNAHFDPKSNPDEPRWFMVDIQLESIFPRPLALEELRGIKDLQGMELLRRGSRLSVQPVTEKEFRIITQRAERAAPRTSP